MRTIRRILLVGHTHHDVGYTNSPRIIDPMHAKLVGRVLELCDEHSAPGPDQFRWTFEVARPVLAFLRQASAADAAKLRDLAAAGRVSVTGGYLNMTQLPDAAEFGHAYDLLDGIRCAGIPVRTEQHGDVNGIAWGAVTEMRHAGIDRLVMALNPDHGRAPFEQPTGFWWEGPTGERVFTWLSTHYGFGEEWGIVDGEVERAERHIREFVERLAARDDYPYQTAVVHAANDNRWPTALFLDVVRHWNATHPDVHMRTATIDDALDVLIREAAALDADGASIPVVRGEWSDWWSHGHGSTAREVAVYREARSLARAAQTLFALTRLRGDGEPALATVLGHRRGPVRLRSDDELARDLAHVDEQLLLYGEHTWGSWETYSKPHSTFSYSHANAKGAFAFDAWDNARDLAIEGLFRFLGSGADATGRVLEGGSSVVVVNPTEHARHEAVTLEVDGSRQATVVASVPPFGVSVVPTPGPPVSRGTADEISSDRYRVIVDPERGGVASLVDRRTGRELIDPSPGHGLGAVIVERVPADSRHPMVTTDPKCFNPEHPGPDFEREHSRGISSPEVTAGDGFTRICWTSSAPGVPQIVSSITLYDELDAIDLDVSLMKPETFDPESIFVAFPFAVDDPEFLLETAGAVFAADSEQLPDTSKDWYSVQEAIGVGDHEHGVLWGTRDAPLVQLGGIHTGQWARTLRAEAGHINSWLMNNLHFTNFQARQEGTGTYRYRFTPVEGRVTREAVRRYGRDLREPLLARQYDGPVRVAGSAGLRIEPADAVIAELRPQDDGAVRVRLRNITGAQVDVRVTAPGSADATVPVSVSAHGIADVVLR
jgi:hypothetical protein